MAESSYLPVGAQRVSGARHSKLYANAFSDFSAASAVVNSEPHNAIPGPCCSCCCLLTCGCCCAPHAPGPAPASECLDNTLRDTMEVDPTTQTLLVSSGFAFSECRAKLRAAGLVLQGTPESDHITIGGAIAVGAHGGGRKKMPLSGYLLEVWLRDGAGRVQQISKGDPDFAAAAVSLGLLGVIVKVRLKCLKPEKDTKTTASSVCSYSAEGLASASLDTHSFQFAPYQERMVRYDVAEADAGCCGGAGCCGVCCCGSNFCGGLNQCLGCTAAIPCVTQSVDSILPCCPALACVLSQVLVCPGTCIYNKFNTFTPVPANYAFSVEYAFDVDLTGQIFEKLKGVVAENRKAGRYVTFRFWCRYIGAVDKSWALAQSCGGDKVAFEFTFSQRQPGVEEFMDSVIRVFQEFGGRPHLGKTLRQKDVAYAAQVYGSAFQGEPWRSFDAVRRRYDPEGLFLNSELRTFVEAAARAAETPK